MPALAYLPVPRTSPTAGPYTQDLLNVVVGGLSSPNSRRAYGRALREFLTWCVRAGRPALDRSLVIRYMTELQQNGRSANTINQHLSAIRLLAREAAYHEIISHATADGIRAIDGIRQEGRRTGNWLTRETAQKLLNAPSTKTLAGLRDRALLAILLGCGLRRAEAAQLTFEHIQQREGRWVLVDLVGKRNKLRSVPMPNWAKTAVDAWSAAAGISQGYIFRRVNSNTRWTTQAIWNTVARYTKALGITGIAPHDLRRTFAKLAYRGGAPIDQIQLSLGHASIQTTERYLGVTQDLTDAPCDHLGLGLKNFPPPIQVPKSSGTPRDLGSHKLFA